jgi:hypothetical protein
MIDQAVIARLLCRHEVIALGVPLDGFQWLPGICRQDIIELGFHCQDFAGVDLDVRCLALHATQWLMDHRACIGQHVALTLFTCGQQERTHGSSLPHADCAHLRLDEVHGVVDRHAGGHHAAWRVDVEADILFRVVRFQKQHLRHDGIGNVIIHPTHQEDDALAQEPRVNIERSLTAAGLFNDHRNEIEGAWILKLAHVFSNVGSYHILPVSRFSIPGAPLAMVYNERMVENTEKIWHGYDVEACQWFMEPRFQNLQDKAIQGAFTDAFLEGKSQARLSFTGHNREADAPDCLYAAKLVRRPHLDGQRLFVIRVDPATMSPLDVQEVPWKKVDPTNMIASKKNDVFGEVEKMPSFLSLVEPEQARMGTVLEQVFQGVADWHASSFGVGPVAPPMGSDDPDDGPQAHEDFVRWQQARLERTTKRQTAQSAAGPRL